MRLPGSDRALIEAAKLRNYLLSSAHPVGRFKAVFFASLGYSPENWGHLEADLRELASSQEALPSGESQYGRKYEVRGTLTGPSGRSAEVVSIWIVLTGEDFPRFVTVYPGDQG